MPATARPTVRTRAPLASTGRAVGALPFPPSVPGWQAPFRRAPAVLVWLLFATPYVAAAVQSITELDTTTTAGGDGSGGGDPNVLTAEIGLRVLILILPVLGFAVLAGAFAFTHRPDRASPNPSPAAAPTRPAASARWGVRLAGAAVGLGRGRRGVFAGGITGGALMYTAAMILAAAVTTAIVGWVSGPSTQVFWVTGGDTTGGPVAGLGGRLAVDLLILALSAGVGEEITLLAAPMLLAGPAVRRQGWWVWAAVAVALRLPIHLYYGWSSLYVVGWAAAGAVLYRACRTVWPLIIGHTLYDAVTAATISSPSWAAASTWLYSVLLAAGGVVFIATMMRHRRKAGPVNATAGVAAHR